MGTKFVISVGVLDMGHITDDTKGDIIVSIAMRSRNLKCMYMIVSNDVSFGIILGFKR